MSAEVPECQKEVLMPNYLDIKKLIHLITNKIYYITEYVDLHISLLIQNKAHY